MFTTRSCAAKSEVLVTTLATLGWLSLMLCWMVLAWGRYNLFQGLAGLSIVTLLFSGVVGVMWARDLGFAPAATIMATLAWLSFALYWVGFAWSRYSLLQNGLVLMSSCLAFGAAIVMLWLAHPSHQC